MHVTRPIASVTALAFLLASCGGGSNSTTPVVTPPPPTIPPTRAFAVPAQEFLSVADVQQVMAQAVAEARARSAPATIAVTDRVGNVLGVFAMNGANPICAFLMRPVVFHLTVTYRASLAILISFLVFPPMSPLQGQGQLLRP